MSNPNFVALYSTDEVYVRQDTSKCLSEELDAIVESIPDPVDTTGFAAADHTHSEYAASNHSHSDYAASNHTHSDYAASEHNHDSAYAPTPAAITAHMGNNFYSAPSGGDYVTLPLTTSVVVGTGFTMENNAIKVGADISKVRISAQVCVGSSNRTNKYLCVRKNTNTQVVRAQMKLGENTTPETMATAALVTSVAENDLLTLDFYGEEGDTIYGGINLTYITVEKLA